jgi:hypothetical protein
MEKERQKRIHYVAQEIRNYLISINDSDIGDGFYFKLVPPFFSFNSNEGEITFYFQDTGGVTIECTVTIHPSGRSNISNFSIDHLTQSLVIRFKHPQISDPFAYKWEFAKNPVLEKEDDEKILYGENLLESLRYAIFHFLKKKSEKLWWLRNNVSTVISQAFDTIIFFTVAFAWVLPASVIVKMIIGDYMVKIVMALLDTPFFYLIVIKFRSVFTQKAS